MTESHLREKPCPISANVFTRKLSWLMIKVREIFVNLVFTLILLSLAGCLTVGPDYERPEVSLPDSWTRAVEADVSSVRSGSAQYWKRFGDPVLNQLVLRAREANPNLRIARLRIREAWHQRGVLAASFCPHASLTGRDDYGILTYGSDGIDVDIANSHGQLGQLDFGWELDVFGQIKRQVEFAEGEYESRVEGWRDAMVFVTGEVALTYIALRTLEKRIEVAKEGREIYHRIHQRIAKRLDLGVSSQLEMQESLARFKTSEALVPRLEQELALVRNRLSGLLAYHPGTMDPLLGQKSKIPTPPESIARGVPAELLRSRPDVRRAERKIAAQTAMVGVMEAELYPKLSISGALTYEYLRRGVTIEVLRRVLGIGSTLRYKIFDGCRDRQRIKEHEAKLDQAIVFYEKTIVEAVTDVENAMSMLHFTKRRFKILGEAREAHKQTATLMEKAFAAGEVDLRRYLNAQADYIALKDEETASEGRRAAHSVRLFKALGGGELAGIGQYPEKPWRERKEIKDQLKKSKTAKR